MPFFPLCAAQGILFTYLGPAHESGLQEPPTRHVGKMLVQACRALGPKAAQQWRACVIATQSQGFLPLVGFGKGVDGHHVHLLRRATAKAHYRGTDGIWEESQTEEDRRPEWEGGRPVKD